MKGSRRMFALGACLLAAGCASASRATGVDLLATPSTRPMAAGEPVPPLQPIAEPTEAQLRDYWERAIAGPLRKGRWRGRIVTASGRPIPDMRLAYAPYDIHGRGSGIADKGIADKGPSLKCGKGAIRPSLKSP